MANLRAGLVGLGMMGRHHAACCGSLDGVELVAVADPAGDPHEVAGGRACRRRRRGAPRRRHRLRASSPSRRPTTRDRPALAEAGVHALIEKPLAADVERRARARGGVRRRGLVGAVGHIERYNPALQHCGAGCRHGELGDVYQVVDPAPGPVPGAHRRRRRGHGPRHPRHRPDGVGDPQRLHLGVGPDGAQERPRARGPRRGRRRSSTTAR